MIGRIFAVVVMAALVTFVRIWRQFFRVYHLATVQPRVLYRDGLRSHREFDTALRRVRPRTVVALLDEREMASQPYAQELAICRGRNIALVRIPIPLGGWPRGEQIRQFLGVARDPARQPVLVHCAQGVRRTGMMVAAYQETVLNFSREQAEAAILSFRHSRRTTGDIERFIDLYNPSEQAMTEDLPMSQE